MMKNDSTEPVGVIQDREDKVEDLFVWELPIH